MNARKPAAEERFNRTNESRSPGAAKPGKGAGDVAHLNLFLRRLCRECSESAVAEQVRQLNHVRHVQAHPERHEIEVWVGFPAEGLLREIVAIMKGFCCELTSSHVR